MVSLKVFESICRGIPVRFLARVAVVVMRAGLLPPQQWLRVAYLGTPPLNSTSRGSERPTSISRVGRAAYRASEHVGWELTHSHSQRRAAAKDVSESVPSASYSESLVGIKDGSGLANPDICISDLIASMYRLSTSNLPLVVEKVTGSKTRPNIITPGCIDQIRLPSEYGSS